MNTCKLCNITLENSDKISDICEHCYLQLVRFHICFKCYAFLPNGEPEVYTGYMTECKDHENLEKNTLEQVKDFVKN